MPGDELRRFFQRNPAFAGQRGVNRQRMGHNRRLGIFGEPEFLVRPLAHQLEQALAKRLIDLAEHVAGSGAGFGQGGAHADRLAALSRKKECAHRNPCWPVLMSRRGLGRTGEYAKPG